MSFGCICLWNTIIIILVTAASINLGQLEFKPITVDNVQNLIETWEIQPITNITVADSICPSETEPLLNDLWLGMETGCVLRDQEMV